MTIESVITTVDNLKRNVFSPEDKVAWLTRLDKRIYLEIVGTHEDPVVEEAPDYTGKPMTTELIAPEPYAQMYPYWVQAQIDYYNGEIQLYNEDITLFNAAYADFAAWYNRTHLPLIRADVKYF